jgi:signal transduction histidine kinase
MWGPTLLGIRSAAAYEGDGLGLAVVRRIAERPGGDAWAYVAIDAGATVWVALGPDV